MSNEITPDYALDNLERKYVKLLKENEMLKENTRLFISNVDYYRGELAGSWFDIETQAKEIIALGTIQ
jgi:hypothetical protein